MCPNPQFPAEIVTFIEKILNENLHFFAVNDFMPHCSEDEFFEYKFLIH